MFNYNTFSSQVWELQDDGNMTKTLKSNSKWLYACAWAPDAKTLASVGDNRSVSSSGFKHIQKVTKGTCFFIDDSVFVSYNSIHVLFAILIKGQLSTPRVVLILLFIDKLCKGPQLIRKGIKGIFALSEHTWPQSLTLSEYLLSNQPKIGLTEQFLLSHYDPLLKKSFPTSAN